MLDALLEVLGTLTIVGGVFVLPLYIVDFVERSRGR